MAEGSPVRRVSVRQRAACEKEQNRWGRRWCVVWPCSVVGAGVCTGGVVKCVCRCMSSPATRVVLQCRASACTARVCSVRLCETAYEVVLGGEGSGAAVGGSSAVVWWEAA